MLGFMRTLLLLASLKRMYICEPGKAGRDPAKFPLLAELISSFFFALSGQQTPTYLTIKNLLLIFRLFRKYKIEN